MGGSSEDGAWSVRLAYRRAREQSSLLARVVRVAELAEPFARLGGDQRAVDG
jgi:hypothetical protein